MSGHYTVAAAPFGAGCSLSMAGGLPSGMLLRFGMEQVCYDPPIRKRRKGGMLMDIVFYMIFIAELIVLHPELVQAAALFFAYAKQVLAHR